jgi:hypothetical protein
LSAIQLENAQLKKEIADKESANVRLIVELQEMREKLESMETLSHSTQSLSDSVETLQSQLRERDREVSNLRSELRQRDPEVHVHDPLVHHEQEVSRAKRAIREAGEINAPKKKRKPAPAKNSKADDHFDDLFVSVRDENAALRVELEFLRSKCKEITSMLQAERKKKVNVAFQQEEFDRMRSEVTRWRAVANGQQSKAAQFAFIRELTGSIYHRMFRWFSAFLLKIAITESKFTTELDDLSIKIGKLNTAYLQVRVLENRRFPLRAPVPDTRDFAAHVDRGVRSIGVFSHAYARAYDYPEEKVPRAAKLAGDSSVLKRFCRRVEGRPC